MIVAWLSQARPPGYRLPSFQHSKYGVEPTSSQASNGSIRNCQRTFPVLGITSGRASNLPPAAAEPISGHRDTSPHQGRVAQLVERSLSILQRMRKVLGSIPSSSKASWKHEVNVSFCVVGKLTFCSGTQGLGVGLGSTQGRTQLHTYIHWHLREATGQRRHRRRKYRGIQLCKGKVEGESLETWCFFGCDVSSRFGPGGNKVENDGNNMIGPGRPGHI